MNKGLIFSAVLHMLVLAAVIFTFTPAFIGEPANIIEPMPVDLVAIGDEERMRQGDESARPAQKPVPMPTVKPPVEDEGQHIGNNRKLDKDTPVNPDETKERDVSGPPPVTGEKKAEDTLPAPEPKPEAPGPRPEPEVKEAAAADTPAEPVVPEPVQEPQAVLPDVVHTPVPAIKPQPLPKPPVATAQKGETLDDILSKSQQALIDRTKTSGGGTKRSTEEATFGGRQNVGADGALQQTIATVVAGCLHDRFITGSLTGNPDYQNLYVYTHFILNQDGSLREIVELTPKGGNATGREIALQQARSAVNGCAPFALPADKYNQWRVVEVNLRVNDRW